MDVQVVGSAAADQQQALPAALPQASAAPVEPAGAQGVQAGASAQDPQSALSAVAAKIFSGGAGSGAASVNVSYRVEHQPNIVVLVFTDPKTGQEISQVPAESLIQLAQFFDKHSGVTLDKTA